MPVKTGATFYFYAMNQRTRHGDSLRTPSNHGVRKDIICTHPSDVGSIRLMICSEEEGHQSSEDKKLASQHSYNKCTDTDHLLSSLEKRSVLGRNHAVERPSSRNRYLSRHSQHSLDRMTQMSSDVNLAAYRVENTNAARFGRCEYSNEERDAKLGVGVLSPFEHRALEREQDMYTDQSHRNCNVFGSQQTSKSPADGKDEDRCRGGSIEYSKRTIDRREQHLYSTTNSTDQPHQHYSVSSRQHTQTSPTDDIKGNSGGDSVDYYIRRTIEILPGVCVQLRGAEETWDCIERDFFMPCMCFGCSHELCCIQDADYVLCPQCRVVSPMDTTFYSSESTNANAAASSTSTSTSADDIEHEGGVGLGFTFDDLLKWQGEIIQGRDFRSGNGI
jgi:hypothetical protein